MIDMTTLQSKDITLLFVDDESNILSALRRLFRNAEMTILTAKSAKEALEVLEKTQVDIIVSDMQMPQMFGDEFLEIVSNKWPHTIRILLTGYSDLKSTINAINKGKISTYVAKPWEDDYLKSVINGACEQIKIRDERDQLQLLTKQQNDLLSKMNLELEVMVKNRTVALEDAIEQLSETNKQLKSNFYNFIKVFSGFAQHRDPKLLAQSRHISRLVHDFALHIQLPQKQAQTLMVTAMLISLGKIILNDNILSKSDDELTQEERAIVNDLPIRLCDILMSLDYLAPNVAIIRAFVNHKENQLNEELSLEVAILTIVYDYCGLTDRLSSENKMSSTEAIKHMTGDNVRSRYETKTLKQFADFIEPSASVTVQAEKKSVMLKAQELRPGMVLSEDVITNNNLILLPEGITLETKTINSILDYQKRTNDKLIFVIKK